MREPRTSHAPIIAPDLARILGCTCGWRTPPGTSNSDDAFAVHAALAAAARSP